MNETKVKTMKIWHAWLIAVGLFLLQTILYKLGNVLCRSFGFFDHAMLFKIDAIDNAIPLTPFFVIFYVSSYVLWFITPVIVFKTKREHFLDYVMGMLLAYFIEFILFIFVPTYMDREAEGILQATSEGGVLNQLLHFVYTMDGGKIAWNLFPSGHCLMSIYSYLGVARQKELSLWYRIPWLIWAILICLSTVLVKQHYVLDIVGGVGIALIAFVITYFVKPGKRIMKKYQNKQKVAMDTKE